MAFPKLRIQFKITVLFIVILVVAVSLNIIWSYANQTAQAQREMLEKTQILNKEIQAVWDYIDINQKRIDTNADGTTSFKNIYCAIAGKSVAALFTRNSDYEIRYVSQNPRKSHNMTDELESNALTNIQESKDMTEAYSIETYNDRQVFRYVSPIYIKESCLSCHGEPAGELDVTGFPKEGLKTGDLVGAVSIIMPVDLYMQGIQRNILQQSLYFFTIFAILIVIAYFAITYLVRQLEKSNRLLKQESSYKSDFLAIVSHELKTPLTSIIAFTEIWEKHPSDAERRKQAIDEVKDNGYILLEMVDNILEAARSDVGQVNLYPEWVDMVDLVSTVERTIRPLADRKKIKLDTDVKSDVPLIYADWEKLRRILENLASNAVKFTKIGGQVWIEISRAEVLDGCADKDSDEIVIKVSDTGIGIREEDIERLFKKFMQLDQSAQRRYKGSGLGLAVVKDLVVAHNGRVEVSSVYKQGSVFSVYIPITAPQNTLMDSED